MFKTLRHRLLALVLTPVALLLVVVGSVGFLYARDMMLQQWREASQLKLERAGHALDMRLRRPLDRLRTALEVTRHHDPQTVRALLLTEMERTAGVSRASVLEAADDPGSSARPLGVAVEHMESSGHDTEGLPTELKITVGIKSRAEAPLERLEVVLPLAYLLQDLKELGWWQSDIACLVDATGAYLSHTGTMAALMAGRHALGEEGDRLELAVLDAMQTQPRGTILGPGHPPVRVVGFARVGSSPLTLIMFAPGRAILDPIIRFRNYYVVAGVGVIALILILIWTVEGRTARMIEAVAVKAQEVARGSYGEPLPEQGRDEISRLIGSFNIMTSGLREKDRILNTFGRYVDPDVARKLLRRPGATRLGGEKREVAILMSDIRDFSTVADTLSPEETIRLINRYFSYMIEEIRRHAGIIVDFYGDGILVFFDPMEGELAEQVGKAICCALDMQRAAGRLNVANSKVGLPDLGTGIAVHAGAVVVGNVGSETRAKYGIVGSAVNVAARAQALARSGEVLVTQQSYDQTRQELAVAHSFDAALKGIQGPVRLYAVEGIAGEMGLGAGHP